MHTSFLFVVVLAALLSTKLTTHAQYHGILINGQHGGTQIYDPFNAPHARGNLYLGLQFGYSAQGGAAVINGQLAYFNSGGTGESKDRQSEISSEDFDMNHDIPDPRGGGPQNVPSALHLGNATPKDKEIEMEDAPDLEEVSDHDGLDGDINLVH